MSHDSRGNEPDVVNNGALAVMLGIVALATLAIALVVTALVRDEVSDVMSVRDESQDRVYRDLRAAQLGKLESVASWRDKSKGIVSLPIGRAMSLVLEEVRANPEKLSPWFVHAAPAAAPAEGATAESVADDGGATPDPKAPKPGKLPATTTDPNATAPALPSALPTSAVKAPPAANTPVPNPPTGKEDVAPLPP